MNRTLRARLTLWYVAVLATVLIAFSIGFYSLLAQSLRKRLDDNLSSATQVTALALNHETEEHFGKAPGEENLRLVLNTMHQTSFPLPSIGVWEGERLVAEKPGLAGLPVERMKSAFDEENTVTEWNAARYRLVFSQVWVQASETRYSVIASEALEPTETEIRTALEILLATVPVCLLLAAAGGYFLARKSLAPVIDMALAADQITSHNLDRRLPVGNARDELGLLAETFNRLFGRLNDAFRQQRQFMADASHELRTPVSVALTAAQVGLQNEGDYLESRDETLEVVQAQMLRLRRVVEDMFTLAHADSGASGANRTEFYIDEVLIESVRAAKVLGAAKDVEIRMGDVPTESQCSGDEGLLRQLLLILLDNAVKYTPPQGHVEVSLLAKQESYVIRIADTGCGISESDQDHIFDRFYRADKSRSRRQPGFGSGAGLGLAIAHWIAAVHDGKVWLERTNSQGSEFCVELPRASSLPERGPAPRASERLHMDKPLPASKV